MNEQLASSVKRWMVIEYINDELPHVCESDNDDFIPMDIKTYN